MHISSGPQNWTIDLAVKFPVMKDCSERRIPLIFSYASKKLVSEEPERYF